MLWVRCDHAGPAVREHVQYRTAYGIRRSWTLMPSTEAKWGTIECSLLRSTRFLV